MATIQHLTTYLHGGAGIAARRIYSGIERVLDSSQVELAFFCRHDQPLEQDGPQHFRPSRSFLTRSLPRRWNRRSYRLAAAQYHRHLANRPPEYEVFSPARLFEPTPFRRKDVPDLLHLHWVAFLFDYLTFFRSIPRRVPIVWTLHDMNPFTGGCHYSAGCEKYRSGCGNCMQLDNPAVDDLSAVNLRQKRQAYRKRNFLVVTPNQWLGRLARDSGIFPADTRFETVHYGIDTERFVSHDTSNLQNRLGIDDRRINLLFGAVDVDVPRKGLAVLLQSLHQLSQPERYRCLVFGNGDSVQRFQQELPESMEVRQLGYLSTDEELCAAYSAADIFLLPSLEDNQPQTGLEALACGTPVVAFDTGGISEMIRPGFNGWLARPHDAAHFAQLISLLGRDRGMQAEFGRNGRNLIVDEFEVGKQSARYIELYEELLRKKLSDPESMQNGEPIDSRGWSRAG